MSLQVFSNNGSSLLASGILSTDLTLTVTAGEGAKFPVISAGQVATCAIEDTSGNIEIVTVTARTVDTLTIVRAQENTAALAFASGSRVENRPTAGVAGVFLQKTGGDTLSGTTTFTGILNQGSAGSIRGGEIAGTAIRGAAGVTGNQILVPSDGTSPATQAASPLLTVANIAAQLAGSGKGVVITGMVLFWSGASNAIPAGYTLCDGTAGTPDLRDQFILCGGGALPTSGGSVNTGSGGSHDHGGATASHVLTIGEMPSHDHSTGASNFTFPASNDDNSQIPMTGLEGSNVQLAGNQTISVTIALAAQGGGGGHTHGINADGLHTHTALPPYRALFAIMKT